MDLMDDLYEQARAALTDWECRDRSPDDFELNLAAVTLSKILTLHKPYVSEPVEIADAVSIDPDRGLVGDWREPDEFERITSRRLWCDACRSDAPCPTYAVILGALGLSASTEESRA